MSFEIVERDNEKNWDLLVLRQEFKELERERHHLRSKSIERQLTSWEMSRLTLIMDEAMELLRRFGSIANNQLNKNHAQENEPLFPQFTA